MTHNRLKLISSLTNIAQFLLGLAIGLASLYHASTRWENTNLQMLFELKELRKENRRIQYHLTDISALVRTSEIHIAKHGIRIASLEAKVNNLLKSTRSKIH